MQWLSVRQLRLVREVRGEEGGMRFLPGVIRREVLGREEVLSARVGGGQGTHVVLGQVGVGDVGTKRGGLPSVDGEGRRVERLVGAARRGERGAHGLEAGG